MEARVNNDVTATSMNNMVNAFKDIVQFGTETVNTSIPDLGTVTSLEGVWT